MLVFVAITACGLAGRYQRFRGTYCLHLQDEVCAFEMLVSVCGSTGHYNPPAANTDILTAMRTSELMYLLSCHLDVGK